MIGTLPAAVREPLVYGMVHGYEHPLQIVLAASIVILLGIVVDYLSDISDTHFTEGIVELVVAQQGRSRHRPVRKPLQSVFRIHVIRPADQSVGDICLARIGRGNHFVHPFLHEIKHSLSFRRQSGNLRLRILLPFPQTRPMPHVPLKMIVVVRYLHVRGNLVMQFLHGKRQSVEIDDPRRHGFRHGYRHPRRIDRPFRRLDVTIIPAVRSAHVDILYPRSPPSGESHIEVEMADFFSAPVPERKPHRGIGRCGTVNPHHHTGPVHFHGSFHVEEIGEDHGGWTAPLEFQGMRTILEFLFRRRQDRLPFSLDKGRNAILEIMLGIDCRLHRTGKYRHRHQYSQ